MDRVYGERLGLCIVHEHNDDLFKELELFIDASVPELEILRFKTNQGLLNWLKKIEEARNSESKSEDSEDESSEQEKKEEEEGEIDLEELEISLMIINKGLIAPEKHNLLERLSQYFVVNEFLSEGLEELPILYVAREDTELDVSRFKKKLIKNIMFSPFDKNVCIGKINWAIMGPPASKEEQLHKEVPPEPIEMLKEVEIEMISELGFRTISNQEINTGNVAKYYIPLLNFESQEGVFAKCTICSPHKEQPGMYRTSFSFFALDAKQIRSVRKYIEEQRNENESMVLPNPEKEEGGEPPHVHISVISEDENQGSRIKDYLSSSFSHFSVYSFRNMMDFQLEAIPALLNHQDEEAEEDEELEDDDPDQIWIEFNEPGDFSKSEPELKAGESIYGVPVDQWKKMKMLLLQSVPEDKRGDVLAYWKGIKDESFIFSLRIGDDTLLLAVDHSEQGEDDATYRRIYFRKATPEEMLEYANSIATDANKSRVIFVSQNIARIYSPGYWTELKKNLVKDSPDEKVVMFIVGAKGLEKHTDLLKLSGFDDYFREPFDPHYLERKVKQAYPLLTTSEPMGRTYHDIVTKIQTGVPVKVLKVSELSMMVKYYRSIEVNKYRHVALDSTEHQKRLECLVRCVGSEKEKDEDGNEYFINYFNFFGLGDASNQYVRMWLNEIYQFITREAEKAENAESS